MSKDKGPAPDGAVFGKIEPRLIKPKVMFVAISNFIMI